MAVIRFIVLALFALLLVYSGPVVNGKSIIDSITQTGCDLTSKNEFNKCYRVLKLAYRNINFGKVSKNDIKEACCSYLAYRDCVNAVVNKKGKLCRPQAAKTAKSLLKSIKGASDICDNKYNRSDCSKPIDLVTVIVLAAIVIGFVVIAILILICRKFC